MLFEQTVLQHLFGKRVLQSTRLGAEHLHVMAGRLAGCVTGEAPLARFPKLLRPTVVQALCDTFAATQRGDALLAPKTFQYDADPPFRRMPTTGFTTDIPDCLLHRCV